MEDTQYTTAKEQHNDRFFDREAEIETESHYMEEYLKFIGANNKADIVNHGFPRFDDFVRFDPQSKFYDEILINAIRHTPNHEFIDIQVKLGKFIFPKISILNTQAKSSIHNQGQKIGRGSFSEVYQCKYGEKVLAVKCFPNNQYEFEPFNYKFKMALRQFCMLKIASALKVGPKVDNFFGYHIIVYSNCIEIAMEFCLNYYDKTDIQIKRMIRNLKQDMRKLHSLKIIHFDIKVENISFSPTFNRIVLIDFGLSKIIKEDLGFKTLSTFCGTLQNCSPELANLYTSHRHELFVDLYYNDMHCLSRAISDISNCILPWQTDDQTADSKFGELRDISDFHKLYYFKYALFQLEYQQLSQLLFEQKQDVLHKIISFIGNLKPSPKLRRFTFQLIRKLRYFKKSDVSQSEQLIAFDFNQDNNEDRIKLIQIINGINQEHFVQYYLSQLNHGKKQGIKQIVKVLQDKEAVKKLKSTDYLILLSKSIELNSTRFSRSQITSFCTVAIQVLGIKPFDYQQKSKSVSNLELVCKYLFQQSIRQKIEDCYFKVLLCMLNNVVILKLYAYNQILQFYNQILQYSLPFQKITKILLNFNAMIQWLGYECQDNNLYDEFQSKIFQANNLFLHNFRKNENLKKKLDIIDLIIDIHRPKEHIKLEDNSILPFINNQFELLVDLKIWNSFQSIRNQNVPQLKEFQVIKTLLVEKQYYSTYHFLYVHFILAYQEIYNQDLQALQSLKLGYKAIPFCQHGPIMSFINIYLQIQSIQSLQSCIRRFISFVQGNLERSKNIYFCRYVRMQLERITRFIYEQMRSVFQEDYVYKIYSLLENFFQKDSLRHYFMAFKR